SGARTPHSPSSSHHSSGGDTRTAHLHHQHVNIVNMYYRLNGITQRLTGATTAAHVPQGLKPGLPAEPSPMIFASPTKIVSTAATSTEYMGRNKVPDLQKFFQKADGIPIHLKKGVMDKMLYRTTMGLTIGGALYCLTALYFAAQPGNK
ncbi:hypothetical protein CRUP_026864, partial [Coryphaenoides rupestris]